MVSVEDQFKQRRLQWFGHVWRMPTSRPQRQLRCRPSGRRRPTGRAPLRWCDHISRDLRDITNWTKMITDRQQWRAHICRNVNKVTPAPVSVSGTRPTSLVGHGEQRRRRCVCACVCICIGKDRIAHLLLDHCWQSSFVSQVTNHYLIYCSEQTSGCQKVPLKKGTAWHTHSTDCS